MAVERRRFSNDQEGPHQGQNMHMRRGVHQRYQDLQQYSQEDMMHRPHHKSSNGQNQNSMIIKRRSQHPDNLAALQIS